MDRLTLTGPVRGDLLSCYGTATAGLLRSVGVPEELAMGTQLFLGVRRAGSLVEFLHHHTPLVGDGVLYRIDLRRRGATEPRAAGEAMARHAEARGVAVVTGCSAHLDWIGAGGSDTAPHWFLVRPSDGSSDGPSGTFQVDDPFTWTDGAGRHHPGFAGPFPSTGIGSLAWSPPPLGPQQTSRERWALGDRRDRPSWSDGRPWQWLEVAGAEVADAGAAEFGRLMCHRTVQGRITDPEVAAHGWATGPDAFTVLAEWLESGLSESATYAHKNDFWVAARNRKMVAASLQSPRCAKVSAGLEQVGAWTESILVPAWTALVRTLHYNALSIARGRRPRPGVLADLRTIAELESRFRERLADAL
ncbi:hypothetical protein [Actinomadura rugatobispora]|uniref:Butirosin biosynthesis protein H N-terminal domain-containing protein n=1 Tax=Actinomadura rugatobispora TaxID=1994 RepID=A0ABW0ZPY0_9ACTN|nr:hypothetical protein GCM10010200_023170 [Actinomadura rugatobispora]